MAASRGLIHLLSWLLSYKEAAINSKDGESGYSALHRAVLYGQLRAVVFLIKQGQLSAGEDRHEIETICEAGNPVQLCNFDFWLQLQLVHFNRISLCNTARDFLFKLAV